MKMRLDRMLSEMGVASRSELREMCRHRHVTVNGKIMKKSDTPIDTDIDEVCVDGERICYEAFSYIMLHKPAGVITAVRDSREKTVMDLIGGRVRKDVAPVGRLDKDTEGLLLLTNDGELAKRLLSPRHHAEKEYLAVLDREPDPAWIPRFAEGLDIGDDKLTAPAMLADSPAEASVPEAFTEAPKVLLTITEGRYHQVKRMFSAVGAHVVYLKRLRMGSLALDMDLPAGAWRPLTLTEIEELKNS